MFRSKQNYWRSMIAAVTLVLGLMAPTTAPLVQAQGNPNPGVLPTNSHAFGKTYGEWSAAWWQWLLSIPAATNPNLDPTGANCAEGQSGKVWFLAGTFGGSATRACTVPHGKALLLPILNTAFGAGVFDCEPTGSGPCVVSVLRASAAAQLDNPMLLQASIDGRPLQSLSSYRIQSPVFSLTFPAGAVFGLPSGTFTPHVSDGYWLLIAPLSAGAHTIHSRGITNSGFEVELTYNLTIGH